MFQILHKSLEIFLISLSHLVSNLLISDNELSRFAKLVLVYLKPILHD